MPACTFLQLLHRALEVGLVFTRVVALCETLNAFEEVAVLLGSTLDLIFYVILHDVLLQLPYRLLFLLDVLLSFNLFLLKVFYLVLEFRFLFKETFNPTRHCLEIGFQLHVPMLQSEGLFLRKGSLSSVGKSEQLFLRLLPQLLLAYFGFESLLAFSKGRDQR